jgi:hypothetical protein
MELLHLVGGKIVAIAESARIPEWAKPIVTAALKVSVW